MAVRGKKGMAQACLTTGSTSAIKHRREAFHHHPPQGHFVTPATTLEQSQNSDPQDISHDTSNWPPRVGKMAREEPSNHLSGSTASRLSGKDISLLLGIIKNLRLGIKSLPGGAETGVGGSLRTLTSTLGQATYPPRVRAQ